MSVSMMLLVGAVICLGCLTLSGLILVEGWRDLSTLGRVCAVLVLLVMFWPTAMLVRSVLRQHLAECRAATIEAVWAQETP